MSTLNKTTIIEIKERKFRLSAFSPLEGLAVLKEILTKELPVDLLAAIDLPDKLGGMLGGLHLDKLSNKMSIEEFVSFEQRLLRDVEEELSAGYVKIYDSFGNEQVNDLSMTIVTRLLIEVIKFNYKDFFIELLQDVGILEPLQEKMKEMEKELK